MLTPLPRCAGSAAEAEAIVHALSAGHVRITPRPVAAEAVAPKPARVPLAQRPRRQKHGTISLAVLEAIESLRGSGRPFFMREVKARCAVEIESNSSMVQILARLTLEGELVELDRDDARRRPPATGNDVRARQWIFAEP